MHVYLSDSDRNIILQEIQGLFYFLGGGLTWPEVLRDYSGLLVTLNGVHGPYVVL